MHLHDSSLVFATFKSGKTKCGKRVARAKLATPDTDATCVACREVAEKEFESVKALIDHARAKGFVLPSDIAADLPKGVSYRNQWIAL